jgi:hypothetical protein
MFFLPKIIFSGILLFITLIYHCLRSCDSSKIWTKSRSKFTVSGTFPLKTHFSYCEQFFQVSCVTKQVYNFEILTRLGPKLRLV